MNAPSEYLCAYCCKPAKAINIAKPINGRSFAAIQLYGRCADVKPKPKKIKK